MTYADIKSHFDHVDSDGNGRIDKDEFMSLVERLGLKRSDDIVDMAFASIDSNENGTIDFAEFQTWIEKATADDEDDGLEVPPHAH